MSVSNYFLNKSNSQIKHELEQYSSISEFARCKDLNRSSVSKYIKSLDIELSHKATQRALEPFSDQSITGLFQHYTSLYEVAKALDTSVRTLRNELKLRNITAPYKHKQHDLYGFNPIDLVRQVSNTSVCAAAQHFNVSETGLRDYLKREILPFDITLKTSIKEACKLYLQSNEMNISIYLSTKPYGL